MIFQISATIVRKETQLPINKFPAKGKKMLLTDRIEGTGKEAVIQLLKKEQLRIIPNEWVQNRTIEKINRLIDELNDKKGRYRVFALDTFSSEETVIGRFQTLEIANTVRSILDTVQNKDRTAEYKDIYRVA